MDMNELLVWVSVFTSIIVVGASFGFAVYVFRNEESGDSDRVFGFIAMLIGFYFTLLLVASIRIDT